MRFFRIKLSFCNVIFDSVKSYPLLINYLIEVLIHFMHETQRFCNFFNLLSPDRHDVFGFFHFELLLFLNKLHAAHFLVRISPLLILFVLVSLKQVLVIFISHNLLFLLVIFLFECVLVTVCLLKKRFFLISSRIFVRLCLLKSLSVA